MNISLVFLMITQILGWDQVWKFGTEFYQLTTPQITGFLDQIYEHAVVEIKKGTPDDFTEELVRHFGDYFVFFERTDEGTIKGGGVVIYPAGYFDHKKEKINYFRPFNTSIKDIQQHLLKVTESNSQEIMQDEFSDRVQYSIK